MKKWVKVFIIVVICLLVLIALFLIWQRNNISAVVTSVSKTEEQIAEELNVSKKQLEEELGDKYSTVIGDFTADEEKQIIKGNLSVDTAVSNLNKRYEETKKNSNSVSEVDKIIGDKVIELYSLKAYYLGQLGQMEATVKREYSALPKDKKNLIGKTEIVERHMGTAMSLLNQCDKQVAGLLADLEKDLKRLKADTSIIKTIRDAYEKEKALKKAYYLKLMEG